MSGVPKSRRHEPAKGFLSHVSEARTLLIQLTKKCPEHYRVSMTDGMLKQAQEGFQYIMAGNCIYFDKSVSADDFRLRRTLMLEGRAKLASVMNELSFYQFMLDQGQNFAGPKSKYYPKVKRAVAAFDRAVQSIGKVISKNKTMWEAANGPLAEITKVPMPRPEPNEILDRIGAAQALAALEEL